MTKLRFSIQFLVAVELNRFLLSLKKYAQRFLTISLCTITAVSMKAPVEENWDGITSWMLEKDLPCSLLFNSCLS